MRKFIVLSLALPLGILFGLGILVVPGGKASAIILLPGGANAANCPQKGFAASFSFDTDTLVRGQENTINFTVNNLSGPGNEFNSVAFGTPDNLAIEIREPAEGIGGPSIATGPWQIFYVKGVDSSEERFSGYDGLAWTTVSDVTASGYAPIKPCTNETFSVKIYVPKSVPLGDMNSVVIAAKLNIKDPVNASQVADSLYTFKVVDAASTTLTTLPKTGFDPALWGGIGLTLLGLPIVFKRRKK